MRTRLKNMKILSQPDLSGKSLLLSSNVTAPQNCADCIQRRNSNSGSASLPHGKRVEGGAVFIRDYICASWLSHGQTLDMEHPTAGRQSWTEVVKVKLGLKFVASSQCWSSLHVPGSMCVSTVG